MREKGSIPLFILTAVIFVGTITGLFYLYQTKFKSEKQPKPSAEVSKPSPNEDTALARFLDNLNSLDKRDFIIKSTDTKDGTRTDSLIQSSKDNKFSMVTMQGGKEIASTVRIGNTIYDKDYTDGRWYKNEVQPSKNLRDPNNPNQKITIHDALTGEEKPWKREYKFLNMEICDSNLRCYKYQVLDNSFPDTLMYDWFDESEFLLRKTLIGEKDGSESIDEYSYTVVNINEPSPLKPVDEKADRDLKRKVDITAIAGVMEANKNPNSLMYNTLAGNQFNGGKIPTDPIKGNVYCVISLVSTTNLAAWTTKCPAGWSPVSEGNPGAVSTWTICAWLENGKQFCKSSR